MIDDSVPFFAFWMFMSAAIGFMVGDAFGDSVRHRECLEQANADLRDQLETARANKEPLRQILKEQRGVINDIHKHVVAVSKGLEKRPS
jgi:hypothetical protein